MISIKDILHQYAATLEKTWEHDRSQTVGASEIGQCARKTWFAKHGAPRDPEYSDGWGARERGNLIERFFWEPAVRAGLPEGARLLYAGEQQLTLQNGYLSATTDGLLTSLPRDALAWAGVEDIGPGHSINLDCKTIDPRVSLNKHKPEHEFQVQVQMGLMREFATGSEPEYSILSYINASFFDDVKEYVVKFDPRIYAAAHTRARDIMEAGDPLSLPPEGKMAGGQECEYCAWASHCAAVTVAGVPKDETPLGDNAIAELKDLRDSATIRAEIKEYWTKRHAVSVEAIKSFLREHDTRRYKGDGWSVSYSATAGRATLDIAAVEAAGIDLSPYYKTGKSSERLTVK